MVNSQALPATQEHTRGKGLYIALIPWVLFTLIAQHGTLQLASIAALVIAIGISVPGIASGRPKVLELGAVGAFAAFTIVAFAADPAVGHWVERYARGIAAAMLALIAFASLATVPFTEQYAREEVPREDWGSPRFKAINRRLTLMWGLVFTAMIPFHIAAGAIDTRVTNIAFNWVVPSGLVLLGIKLTATITEHEEA